MISAEFNEKEVPSPLQEVTIEYGRNKKRGIWGVSVYVKSPEWEKLFTEISDGKVIFWKKNGIEGEFYNLPQVDSEKGFAELVPYGAALLREDPDYGTSIPSLFFLRSKGIGAGVETFFPGMFEKDVVRKFGYLLGDRSEALFKKLSPGSMKITVWIGDWKEKGR